MSLTPFLRRDQKEVWPSLKHGVFVFLYKNFILPLCFTLSI